MSRCISTSLIGLPRIRALPAVGKIRPIRSLIVVDLPAPFGPIKPNTSLVSTCMFSPSSDVFFLRCKNPKGYSLVRFSISIAAPGMPSLLGSRGRPSIAQPMECAWSENGQKSAGQLRSECTKSGVAARVPDLYQLRLRSCRRRHGHRLQVLRVAPVIQHPYLLHARNRAARRAKLFRRILTMAHLRRVLCQRNPRIAPLLRAPVHQPVLANVQVTRPRTAAPVVFLPTRHVMLEFVES